MRLPTQDRYVYSAIADHVLGLPEGTLTKSLFRKYP